MAMEADVGRGSLLHTRHRCKIALQTRAAGVPTTEGSDEPLPQTPRAAGVVTSEVP
jgi:hypothetical protein